MTTIINASTAGLTETVDISGTLALQTANTTAILISTAQDINCTSTGAITVPVGTTAQRPTGVNGMLRYNSSTSKIEVFVASAWANVSTA